MVLDVAELAGALDRLGHVALDAGVLREVAVDEILRVAARDAEPLRQAEG